MANAKTLRKRIALVAAAAVGVGVLVAAPAFAAVDTTYTVGTLGTVTPTTPVVGTAVSVPVNVTTTGSTISAVDNFTATLTTKPNDSALTTQSTTVTTSGFDATKFVVGAATSSLYGLSTTNAVAGTSGAVLTISNFTTALTALTTASAGAFGFTPDVPGVYVLTIIGSSTQTVTITVGGLAATQATGGKGGTSSVTAQVGGNVTYNYVLPAGTAAGSIYTATSSGATIVAAGNGTANLGAGVYAQPSATGALVKVNGTDYTSGVKYTSVGTITQAVLVGAPSVSEMFTVTMNASVAGTSTLTISSMNASTGALTTVVTATTTWGAAPAFSAANTTAYIAAGTTPPVSPDATVSAAKTAATTVANIKVTVKDQFGNALSGETLSATVSGPGLIALGNTLPGAGTARAVSLTTSGNTAFVAISADGTAGVSTITVSDGTTVIATKTVTFTGSAATYAVTQGFSAYRVGSNGTDGSSSSYGVAVKVTDSNGNTVADGTTVYATSGTTANATITASQTTTSGYAYFAVAGVAEGTSVLTFANASSSPTLTATTTVNVTTSVAAKVTLTFDKATYNPGDKVVLTLTAKDAAGQPISDVAASTATYTNFLTADLAPSTSLGGASLSGSKTPTFTNGVTTWTLYAPLTAGPFSVNATTGTATGLATAAQSQSLSASATVTAAANADSAAAKAAAAAAQASADAAAKAVAALSVTVAALIASVTAQLSALTVIVKKIQKKLRIK